MIGKMNLINIICHFVKVYVYLKDILIILLYVNVISKQNLTTLWRIIQIKIHYYINFKLIQIIPIIFGQ